MEIADRWINSLNSGPDEENLTDTFRQDEYIKCKKDRLGLKHFWKDKQDLMVNLEVKTWVVEKNEC